MVQWLGLRAFTAMGASSVPGWGTKIPQAVRHSQKKTKKKVTRGNQRWASLVAQWLRIRLPMQGSRVQALVWEDPTCRGASKSVRHNY